MGPVRHVIGGTLPAGSVQVFDWTTLDQPTPTLVLRFNPESSSFHGGPGPGAGLPRGRRVRPTTTLFPVADFVAIDDPSFTGGAHCAVGDVNSDGIPNRSAGPESAGVRGCASGTAPPCGPARRRPN